MNSRVFSFGVLILSLFSAGSGGCGSAEPPRGYVSGEVTLDGAPVTAPNSMVKFYSASTNSLAGEAQITGGKYAISLPLGDMNVKFTGYREPRIDLKKNKQGIKPKPEDLVTEFFPDKYSKNSAFKITVKEGESKEDFHCKSDEPTKKK